MKLLLVSDSYCLCQLYKICVCLAMFMGVSSTSIESSVLSRGGLRLIMLAVPSSASLSSFRKTPQNGTTFEVGTGERKTHHIMGFYHPVIKIAVVTYVRNNVNVNKCILI